MKNLIAIIAGALLTYFSINSTLADQNHPELPELFERLKNADSSQQAALLEREIWNKWKEHESGGIEIVSAFMLSGKYSEALDASNHLVVKYPDFAEAWNRRATLFFVLGDFHKAMADLEKTLTLEPRHFGAVSGVALMMRQTGRNYQAFLAFQKVLEISPKNTGAKKAIEELDMGLEDSI